jgi:hypothetical protein
MVMMVDMRNVEKRIIFTQVERFKVQGSRLKNPMPSRVQRFRVEESKIGPFKDIVDWLIS